MNLDRRLTEATKQVTRLEAANAAKDAALRAQEALDMRQPNPFGHDCQWCPRCVLKVAELRRAALSDTGEGWLEVREQAKGAIEELFSLADRIPAEVRQRVEDILDKLRRE